MQTIRRTRQLVSAYANGDTREVGHDEAQVCLDIEENLAWGVRIFDGLKAVDARLQAHFLDHPDTDSAAADDAILECYRIFRDACRSHLDSARPITRTDLTWEGHAELNPGPRRSNLPRRGRRIREEHHAGRGGARRLEARQSSSRPLHRLIRRGRSRRGSAVPMIVATRRGDINRTGRLVARGLFDVDRRPARPDGSPAPLPPRGRACATRLRVPTIAVCDRTASFSAAEIAETGGIVGASILKEICEKAGIAFPLER